MQLTYAFILGLCLFGPLIAQLWPRLRVTYIESCIIAQAVTWVAVPFVIIDMFVHARGWWSYNPTFILGYRIAGLPIEEIAFFFVVPFACLFLYVALGKLLSVAIVSKVRFTYIAVSLVVFASSVIIQEMKERTVIDGLVMIGVIALLYMDMKGRAMTNVQMIWSLLVAGLFLIVNGVLTGIPVVTYDHSYGSALRIGSIPVADMLYNVSLLVSVLLVYRYLIRRADRTSSGS